MRHDNAESTAAERAGVRKPFVRTTLLTFGSNLGFATLSLLNVLIVSRVLGPTGRGEVAFLTAIAWFTAHLSTLGVQEANVNIGGAEPALRRSLATNSLCFAALFGTATIGILTLLISAVPAVAGPSSANLRWLTLASLPLLILGIYLRFLIQADYGFGVTNLAYLLGPVANATINGALALAGVLSVTTALSTWIGGQVLSTLILAWYVQARLAGFGRPSMRLARRTLAFGVRSHAGRVMLLGNYRLDQWILGAVSGAREVGLYSVAVAWAEALWHLPTALAAVQRPDLVRASEREARRAATYAFRVSIVLTVVFAAALAAAAEILCTTFFGSAFSDAVPQLRILTLGAFGVVAMKQLGSALTARKRPTLASAAIAVSFVCTLVLDIILIPRYDGIGAAIASSVAYSAGGLAIAAVFVAALRGSARELMPKPREIPGYVRRLVAPARASRVAAPAPAGRP